MKQQAAGRPRPRTLLVFGREPGTLRAIDASGGVGFLHDIVELAGGDNVFGGERRESLRVSTEAILAAAPEVIIDLHYGRSLAEEELKREREAWNACRRCPRCAPAASTCWLGIASSCRVRAWWTRRRKWPA